jgi:hypothetical protein
MAPDKFPKPGWSLGKRVGTVSSPAPQFPTKTYISVHEESGKNVGNAASESLAIEMFNAFASVKWGIGVRNIPMDEIACNSFGSMWVSKQMGVSAEFVEHYMEKYKLVYEVKAPDGETHENLYDYFFNKDIYDQMPNVGMPIVDKQN